MVVPPGEASIELARPEFCPRRRRTGRERGRSPAPR